MCLSEKIQLATDMLGEARTLYVALEGMIEFQDKNPKPASESLKKLVQGKLVLTDAVSDKILDVVGLAQDALTQSAELFELVGTLLDAIKAFGEIKLDLIKKFGLPMPQLCSTWYTADGKRINEHELTARSRANATEIVLC
jgi:hypothetical protein